MNEKKLFFFYLDFGSFLSALILYPAAKRRYCPRSLRTFEVERKLCETEVEKNQQDEDCTNFLKAFVWRHLQLFQ